MNAPVLQWNVIGTDARLPAPRSLALSGGIFVLIVELLGKYGPIGLYLLTALWFFLLAVRAVVSLIVDLARRPWRRMVAILAAPVVVGLLGWLAHATGFSADRARLLLFSREYLAEIAARPGVPAPIQIGVWTWRDYPLGLWGAVPQEIDALVYDSSDQIILPLRSRTEDWFSSADAAGYSSSVIIHPERIESVDMFEHHSSVKQIGNHFYIVSAEF